MSGTDSGKRLLILGAVFPESNSSAAGVRMMQLIELFASRSWDVVFASTSEKSIQSDSLEHLKVRCEVLKVNDSAFDIFLKELDPEVVIFDRFYLEEQFSWRVMECCPNALRIVDTEDLHGLRLSREEAYRKGMNWNERVLDHPTMKRELASLWRSDLNLIISDEEMKFLRTTFDFPEFLLSYLPIQVQLDLSTIQKTKFSERKDFVFVGSFRHPPNRDAVRMLKENIWSKIRRELPEAKIHIYGSYADQKAKAFHNESEGFLVHGYVENLEEVMQESRVMLAPLNFGAGLKGKLLRAMEQGLPSVTTSIGAEGIQGAFDWPGVVSNEPDEFVQSAIELYNSSEKWGEANRRIVPLLEDRFIKTDYSGIFLDQLEKTFQSLEEHRRKNYLGAILCQQRQLSTRYLSKYIETKQQLAQLTEQDLSEDNRD
ncbi:MAG: glycosyltransferase [Bacteroidetes bacterium]|nr:MAG: glycosyltransferase [Bacteroidota bacterium]